MNLSKITAVTAGKTRTTGVSPFSELELSKVYPNPNQPRKQFDDIEDLALTIKEHGLLQPIAVVKRDDGYMIVSGERRFRAHVFNEAATIKAHIINVEDHQIKELALIENIQRSDLTDFEKAKYIGELWASGKYTSKSELAKKIGKSSSYISKAFGCLKLDETILEDLENNISTVPLSVLEEISRVKDKDTQIEVYDKYVTGTITRDDIKSFKEPKKKENFPWEKAKTNDWGNIDIYSFENEADFFNEDYNVLKSTDFIGANMKAYIVCDKSILKKNVKYKITIEEI